eukprot:1333279-Prymnesium_polylepis.1
MLICHGAIPLGPISTGGRGSDLQSSRWYHMRGRCSSVQCANCWCHAKVIQNADRERVTLSPAGAGRPRLMEGGGWCRCAAEFSHADKSVPARRLHDG